MKKIIVACSGGPDSMALLDKMVNQGYRICVAHVNYKKRDTADRDQQLLEEYCQKHGVDFRVCFPKWNGKENFQSWARDVRYQFFGECAQSFGTNEIYVAHQMDDVIETYIFQKERGMIPDVYGIQSESERGQYRIVRPLLMYEKKELEAYCQEHDVPYGIDESNLTNDYTRNKIRHSKIDTMTRSEKEDVIRCIQEDNAKLQKQRQSIQGFSVLDHLNHPLATMILDTYLYAHTKRHYGHKHLKALLQQLHSDCEIDLQTHVLERFQNQLYCVEKTKPIHILLENVEIGSYGTFELCQEGKTIEGITLDASDFPICIRNAKPSDRIQLRYGRKKVHRFFIDRKIPKHLRAQWLVVENAKKQVIFVPGIGCDTQHFSVKPTVFMLQCLA